MEINLLLGEFFGTMILILLGNGTVANVLLSQSKGENSGWMVITTGWGFAVMVGVFVALAFGSPAHLNPAVTIAFAVSGGDFSLLLPFITAQMLGAFTGATLVWIHHGPHWKVTKDQGIKLACFCTSPAIRNYRMNLISEIIGTFVLVLGVAAIFAKELSPGMGPLLVGALVWGIGIGLGGPTGYAINPARDLGPRLAHWLLPISDKGDSDFAYSPIPVFGPAIGAVLAGLFLLAFPVF
ncbi:MAG TPA: MIP/aquaporin family protein [Saprospiraceae bacterium]|nr:MIP/aquaporin family protein [Saprospiraceae bacterium]HMQ82249.1 MIP/aquaporin family protein [Saprospiraceae bacterium]